MGNTTVNIIAGSKVILNLLDEVNNKRFEAAKEWPPVASGALPAIPAVPVDQDYKMQVSGGKTGATWTDAKLVGGSASLDSNEIGWMYFLANNNTWSLVNVQELPRGASIAEEFNKDNDVDAVSANQVYTEFLGGEVGVINEVGEAEHNESFTGNYGEKYYFNKRELSIDSFLEKIEFSCSVVQSVVFVIGFLDQNNKFIEKFTKTQTTAIGVNEIEFNQLMNVGDYVGIKRLNEVYTVDSMYTPESTSYAYTTNGYNGVATKDTPNTSPIKLFLKEYKVGVMPSKAEVLEIKNTAEDVKMQFNNKFTKSGQKVDLVFMPDGSVTWKIFGQFNKIVHLGNSICKHPIINGVWWGNWGMASTVRENDYVHKFLAKYQTALNPLATTEARNISDWETNPTTWNKSQLDSTLLNADLITVSVGENASYNSDYQNEFKSLIHYIQAESPTATIIICGQFWQNSNKEIAMQNVANELDLRFVSFSDTDLPIYKNQIGDQVFGDDNQWHAIPNNGVANHPNDAWFELKANRLMSAVGL